MPTKQLIDTHCHLDFKVFDDDRADVLQRAKDNGISDIIIPGTQQKYWQRITRLTDNSPALHPCYGLHPYWIAQHSKTNIRELEQYITTNKTVAVGECGLDFRTSQADKKLQLYFFEAQLNIAESLKLPVVIHAVNATEDVIRSVKKFKNLRGMIHSYSGSLEQAKRLIDLNFYISISGSVTYDNAKKIRNVASHISLTSLLIETDAPDQVDKKNKDKRNEPAFLLNTLTTIAGLRNKPLAVITEQTTHNAKRLFSIK